MITLAASHWRSTDLRKENMIRLSDEATLDAQIHIQTLLFSIFAWYPVYVADCACQEDSRTKAYSCSSEDFHTQRERERDPDLWPLSLTPHTDPLHCTINMHDYNVTIMSSLTYDRPHLLVENDNASHLIVNLTLMR